MRGKRKVQRNVRKKGGTRIRKGILKQSVSVINGFWCIGTGGCGVAILISEVIVY